MAPWKLLYLIKKSNELINEAQCPGEFLTLVFKIFPGKAVQGMNEITGVDVQTVLKRKLSQSFHFQNINVIVLTVKCLLNILSVLFLEFCRNKS